MTPHLPHPRTCAVAGAVLYGLLVASAALAVDPRIQDDVDRSRQAQRARAFELQMDLDARSVPAPLPESELRRSVAPSAGTGILDVLPRVPEAGETGVVDGPIDSVGVPAVTGDQRRRQQGLQAQTRKLPDAQRRQTLDVQQLQFERELQSERLRSEIMRNSERALRR
jgi:hypothetical protein